MMRSLLTLILILVSLALAACTPGSAQVARIEAQAEVEAEDMSAATATAAPTLTPKATVSLAPSPTATWAPSATATLPPTMTPRPAATSTATATALLPAATPTPEGPAVLVQANANIRSGPSTAYPVIGGARAGDRLSVTGRFSGWWQIALAGRAGWIWGELVSANTAAEQAPEVVGFPLPPTPTSPPPTVEVKVEAEVEPTATPTSTSTLTSASPLPDLVVLGPDTQYPVRARVIRGWDYEFVDLSAAYDIVVYRDVFGMLAHQIDDENVQRYRRQSRFARSGPIRITLVDAQPHPDAGCPGWGWAPDRDTFVDPYGMTQEPCRVEHSLFPQGDGAGTTLLIGWGYNAGTTLAIGAAGPYLADASTTFLAETLPWPGNLGPADRPDFSQPLYRPLGAAHQEDGRWVWQDAFAAIVPAGW